MDEWVKVRDTLEGRGYDVYWMAEDEDLLDRAAMYAQAKMNLMAAGGPSALAISLGVPYMTFKPATAGVYCSSKEFWASFKMTAENNSQFPNARHDQRIVWEDDTAENILNAVDKMESVLCPS